jgi:hypothetical protein
MTLETGDIFFNSGLIGHAAIVYDSNEYYHANSAKGFHSDMDPNSAKKDKILRPPGLGASQKEKLQNTITAISTAGYRKNMFNAAFGSKQFGPSAKKRLDKYQERLLKDENPVIAVTCAEACILCYQLTFYDEPNSPFFIDLDGKHSMPANLAKWLSDHRWTPV